MRKTVAFLILYGMLSMGVFAQHKLYQYEPGFNARECDDMLRLNNAFLDTTKNNQFNDFIPNYSFLYRSPNIGLDNAWDLWIRTDSTIVLVLRGTTGDAKSIVADFFCAMVPATGQIALSLQDTIRYQLASDKRAAVHAGFLVGFSFLAKDITPKLDSLYKKGYYRYLITGHSQGGSLSYFVSSWMIHLKKNGVYPSLQVKTYASAPTKVGNMYFAYEYDHINQADWAFSIINTADPVPELPFTTQQFDIDVNEPNPMLNLFQRINELPFLKKIILKHAFNKMRNGSAKSAKAYQKYLGGYSEKLIKQMIPELTIPQTVNTTYFVRPGVNIVLMVNETYYNHFEPIKDGPYYHHGITPYRFLLRQYYKGLTKLEE